MQLSTLLSQYLIIAPQYDCAIRRLTLDSRTCLSGDVFFAIKGSKSDGQAFITSAIERGAAAIVTEGDNFHVSNLSSIPVIHLPQLIAKLGPIAAKFYDFPSKNLNIFGVTGTNGKTSCTHFIAQLLTLLREPCGVIGTLGIGLLDHLKEVGLTTPDAINLQGALAQFKEEAVTHVAMEVSSHSIAQERITGIDFKVGIFTNLTEDHLDYHGDMATYAAVKRRFLTEFPVKYKVVNAEDDYGIKWLNNLSPNQTDWFAYSTKPLKLNSAIPLIYTDEVVTNFSNITAKLFSPWGAANLDVPLLGRFNLSNLLPVIASLCLQGIPLNTITAQLSKLHGVPGRMQKLGGGQQPLVVVDYSHTPDALKNALIALRSHTLGKLCCVFGCGGDRDALKRPLMAEIAERYADEVIVTNDNPRSEKPENIAAQIFKGFREPNKITLELDRSKAIEKSIKYSSSGDCVLIAGKGAECYQQIQNEKIYFSDIAYVQEFLNAIVVE